VAIALDGSYAFIMQCSVYIAASLDGFIARA
jgi:hypothetical protein